jgi:hypothetical protein
MILGIEYPDRDSIMGNIAHFERGTTMRSRGCLFLVLLAALVFAATASADTLELKDGRILEGRYLGGTQAVLRFEVNGEIQTFNVTEIVALTFTGTSGSGQTSSSTAPASTSNLAPTTTPAPAPQATTPTSNTITIPAGQALLVRMIDSVNSKKNNVGDVFHASLETDLNVNGVLIARKGTDIYGRLAEAKEAGHFSGSAELELELTRIVIDGRDYPVVSSDYTLKGKGRGSNTAEKVGGGAIAGAIIGAIAGGGKGAAIGATAGSAAGAGVQVFTRGQQVNVPSETLLEFRLQQPVTVTPTQQ